MTVAERGCGHRVAGGVYLEVPVSDRGLPLEHFIIDPPVPVNPEVLGLTPVGVTAIERDGITHIFDWVGSSHYPNVLDVLLEAQHLGLSRRISRTEPALKKLTKESRIYLIHSRGWMLNFKELQEAIDVERSIPLLNPGMATRRCPKGKSDHLYTPTKGLDVMCAGLWWDDIEPGAVTNHAPDSSFPRRVVRQMPSFSYTAWETPRGFRGDYRPALIASFPIAQITVIRDEADPANQERSFQAVKNANLPVQLEDE